jgi:hypothetical protein
LVVVEVKNHWPELILPMIHPLWQCVRGCVHHLMTIGCLQMFLQRSRFCEACTRNIASAQFRRSATACDGTRAVAVSKIAATAAAAPQVTFGISISGSIWPKGTMMMPYCLVGNAVKLDEALH